MEFQGSFGYRFEKRFGYRFEKPGFEKNAIEYVVLHYEHDTTIHVFGFFSRPHT